MPCVDADDRSISRDSLDASSFVAYIDHRHSHPVIATVSNDFHIVLHTDHETRLVPKIGHDLRTGRDCGENRAIGSEHIARNVDVECRDGHGRDSNAADQKKSQAAGAFSLGGMNGRSSAESVPPTGRRKLLAIPSLDLARV